MSDHDISSDENGIKFTGSIDLDWGRLGETFTHASSDDQAAFFEKFRESIVNLGHAGQLQLAFIGSSLQVTSARWDEVAGMLRDLAAFIDPNPEVE